MAKKCNLKDIILDEVSVVGKGANGKAKIMLMKGMTKREGGEDFPASAFAYVPDPEKPSTWKLRLWDSLSEKATTAQVGRAVAAMGKGFRGNKVSIPDADIAGVKKKVLAAWLKVNSGKTREDAPDVIKIFKFMDEGKTFDEIMDKREFQDKVWDMVWMFEDSVRSIMNDENVENKAEMINESASQFQSKLITLLKGENMGDLEKVTKERDTLQGQCDTFTKEVDDLKKKLAEAVAKLADLNKKNDVEKKDDDINKDELPEGIRKRFEYLEKKDKDNQEMISKLLEEKENNVFIKKAAVFKNLTVVPDEFGPLLNKISKALPEGDFEKLMAVFTSANEVIGKGKLFEEEGTAGDTGGDALKKMDTLASEIMKADPTITKEKAFIKVMEQNPELYNQYLDEK